MEKKRLIMIKGADRDTNKLTGLILCSDLFNIDNFLKIMEFRPCDSVEMFEECRGNHLGYAMTREEFEELLSTIENQDLLINSSDITLFTTILTSKNNYNFNFNYWLPEGLLKDVPFNKGQEDYDNLLNLVKNVNINNINNHAVIKLKDFIDKIEIIDYKIYLSFLLNVFLFISNKDLDSFLKASKEIYEDVVAALQGYSRRHFPSAALADNTCSIARLISLIIYNNEGLKSLLEIIKKDKGFHYANLPVIIDDSIIDTNVGKILYSIRGVLNKSGIGILEDIVKKYSDKLNQDLVSYKAFQREYLLEDYFNLIYKGDYDKYLVKKCSNVLKNNNGYTSTINLYLLLTFLYKYSIEELEEMNLDPVFYALDCIIRKDGMCYYTYVSMDVVNIRDLLINEEKAKFIFKEYLNNRKNLSSFITRILDMHSNRLNKDNISLNKILVKAIKEAGETNNKIQKVLLNYNV